MLSVVCVGVSLSSCCLGGCACGFCLCFGYVLCVCVSAGLFAFCLLLLLHFELADLLLSNLFLWCDLGCWGWVGAGASVPCCLYVVVLGLSFGLWCQFAFLF
jgi:hypothetical protein